MTNSNQKQIIVLKKKKTLYNYITIALFISLVILTILFTTREYRLWKSNKDAKEVLEAFKSLSDDIAGSELSSVEYEKVKLKMGKYKVIGTIKIDVIGVEYPILEKTTEESLNLSITKLSGPALNSLGNVTIAGHNANNGTWFSRLSLLKKGDIIEITGSKKNTLKYKVYNMYIVSPDDVSPLETTNKDIREITLVSCIQDGKKRIVIKAIEVSD